MAGKPRSRADPAAEKPSPQPQAWRPETDRLPSLQYTRRGTAIAEHHSPTVCGKTGPHLQVGISQGQRCGHGVTQATQGRAVPGPHLARKGVGSNGPEGACSTSEPGILFLPVKHYRVSTKKLKAVEDRAKGEMERLLATVHAKGGRAVQQRARQRAC